MTLVQVLAIAFIVSVVASPLIGNLLHKRRIRRELRNLLNTSEADWAVKHREFMARRRSGQEIKLNRDALIDVVEEECKPYTEAHRPYTNSDDEGAFMDSENEQPHPTNPRAA